MNLFLITTKQVITSSSIFIKTTLFLSLLTLMLLSLANTNPYTEGIIKMKVIGTATYGITPNSKSETVALINRIVSLTQDKLAHNDLQRKVAYNGVAKQCEIYGYYENANIAYINAYIEGGQNGVTLECYFDNGIPIKSIAKGYSLEEEGKNKKKIVLEETNYHGEGGIILRESKIIDGNEDWFNISDINDFKIDLIELYNHLEKHGKWVLADYWDKDSIKNNFISNTND